MTRSPFLNAALFLGGIFALSAAVVGVSTTGAPPPEVPGLITSATVAWLYVTEGRHTRWQAVRLLGFALGIPLALGALLRGFWLPWGVRLVLLTPLCALLPVAVAIYSWRLLGRAGAEYSSAQTPRGAP